MELTQKERILLKQAQDTLTQLSLEKLQTAVEFLSYLQEKEAEEATEELLSIANFEDELKEAEKEAESGEVVSFNSIRRNV